MPDSSPGDLCRTHIANVRTMCEEIEDLLAIGALRGFGRAAHLLGVVSERLEAAVTAAADASGAVGAETPQAIAAEIAEQDKRTQQRERLEAAARFDIQAVRNELIRADGGLPPDEERAARRERRSRTRVGRQRTRSVPDEAG